MDRRMAQSLDRWLTTPPEERYPMTKTLKEFISELQAIAAEHGDDIAVEDADGVEVEAVVYDEDEDGPVVVVG